MIEIKIQVKKDVARNKIKMNISKLWFNYYNI